MPGSFAAGTHVGLTILLALVLAAYDGLQETYGIVVGYSLTPVTLKPRMNNVRTRSFTTRWRLASAGKEQLHFSPPLAIRSTASPDLLEENRRLQEAAQAYETALRFTCHQPSSFVKTAMRLCLNRRGQKPGQKDSSIPSTSPILRSSVQSKVNCRRLKTCRQ
jgi:hypothetical protein